MSSTLPQITSSSAAAAAKTDEPTAQTGTLLGRSVTPTQAPSTVQTAPSAQSTGSSLRNTVVVVAGPASLAIKRSRGDSCSSGSSYSSSSPFDKSSPSQLTHGKRLTPSSTSASTFFHLPSDLPITLSSTCQAYQATLHSKESSEDMKSEPLDIGGSGCVEKVQIGTSHFAIKSSTQKPKEESTESEWETETPSPPADHAPIITHFKGGQPLLKAEKSSEESPPLIFQSEHEKTPHEHEESSFERECDYHFYLSLHRPSKYIAECIDVHDGKLVMKLYTKSLAKHLTALVEQESKIKKTLPYSERQLLSKAIDTAKGIKHLHSLGIRHEDIKPHNIFIDADGTCVLGDLGSMKQFTDLSAPSGTPAFMSPDISEGYLAELGRLYKKLPDGSSDIWSFGMTLLYSILHNIHDLPILTPYSLVNLQVRIRDANVEQGETPQSIFDAMLAPALQSGSMKASDSIVALIQRCLRVNPEERPSIDELIDTMEELLTSLDRTTTD